MASGTANSPSRRRATGRDSETSREHNQFIELQLARTRRRVKLVDLGSALMGLVGGITLYTLGIVLTDHWLIDLNAWGRFAALVILVVGAGYFGLRFVVPLFVRQINPTYAARAIEQSDPSLKNSLINFLMFRRDASPTGRLVYRAVRQRAAQDLQAVNIDLAVDRSRLIHVGYVVVALMILLAAYTVFSPKDVFQSVRRIAIPWADISRPSRVQISNVMPGDTVVVFGQKIDISAKVLGLGDEDQVTLFYSSEDQQIVNQTVPMAPAETGDQYLCGLPADNRGIEQNLRYHIEAGDARSAEYLLSVRHIPTIVVRSIQYEYPAYTQREQRVVEGDGAVFAIEGTRVTVHVQANYPIKRATIQFDPARPTESSQTMQSSGDKASYTFRLLWNEDRKGPAHTSYCLSFTTDDDRAGELSVEHPISISRDLPPDIEILTPRKRELELPVNRLQTIEIRALDPDFGLTRVVLQGVAGGKQLLDETLMNDAQGRTGQNVLEYEFSPSRLKLTPGNKFTYWAIAEDNHTAPQDDSPQPNSARTESYIITIGPADETGSGSSDAANNDAPQDGSPEPAAEGTSQQPTPARAQPSDNQPPREDQGSENQGAPDNPQQDNPPQNEQGDSASEQESGAPGEQSNNEGSSSSSQANQGETGEPQGGDPQAAQEGEQTEGSQMGSGGEQEEGAQQGDAANQMPAGGQGGAGGNKSENETGQNAENSQDQQGGAGGGANRERPNSTDSSEAPGTDGQQGVREEGLHDGEVFERMLRQLEKAGSQASGTEQRSAAQQPPPEPNGKQGQQTTTEDQNPAGAAGEESQSDGAAEKNRSPQQPGEGSQGEMNGAAQESPGQGESSGGSEAAATKDTPDQPGNQADHAAGQGENADPQQSSSEQSLGKKSPTSAAGSNDTEDAAGEPGDKQTGRDDEGEAGSGQTPDDPDDAANARQANGDRDEPSKALNRDAAGNDSPQGSSNNQQPPGASHDGEANPGDGGEPNRGQSVNQPGGEDSGSDMSSNQENSGAQDSGERRTADPGDAQQPSPDPTGQSGEQPGAGTNSQTSPTGEQQAPDGTSSPSPTDSQSDPQRPSPDQRSPDPNTTRGGSNEPPQSGGSPSDATGGAGSPRKEIPDGDEANLDYARKATDLVLERLQDQQNDPDPELLESLGWTKEELKQFVARWEALKRAAREESGEARSELDDALRSLGLRPTTPAQLQSKAANDPMRGMRDSGQRSRPPAEFMEQFNAYKKGAARGQTKGG